VTFEPKASLMQEVPQTRTFKLPFWAIAASWALVIGSFALWVSNAVSNPNSTKSTYTASTIEIAPKVEHQVELAQHLPKGDKEQNLNQDINVTSWKKQTHIDWNEWVYGAEEKTMDAKSDGAEKNYVVVNTIPTPGLKANIFSDQTQLILYKPWKGYKDELKTNDRIDDIAVLDPLKRISPKRYLKIRDFNLVDDVMKEIDGDQIARAITPEILQ